MMLSALAKLMLHQYQDYANEITMPADCNIMYKNVYLLEPQLFCYLMKMTLNVYGVLSACAVEVPFLILAIT